MQFVYSIKLLEEKEKQLVNELNAIRKEIYQLKGASSSPKVKMRIDDDDEYDNTLPYVKKVLFFIKDADHFCHNHEIVDMYIAREKKKITDDQKKKLVVKTTNALSKLGSENTIIKKSIHNNLKNTFWGFKDWLDANGNIKPEYNYNKAYYQTDIF